jgi:hypothetical protein
LLGQNWATGSNAAEDRNLRKHAVSGRLDLWIVMIGRFSGKDKGSWTIWINA